MILPEIDCYGLSEAGPVRASNQDAVRLADGIPASDRGLLYALADGMGGYAHGEVASGLALDTLYETFSAGEIIMPVGKHLKRSVEAANLSVYQAGQRLGSRMGTTLTAANVLRHRLTLAHVGDCRAYLVRGGQALCLTHDHTVVGDLVRMKVLTPEKLRTHEQRSVLNRALGLGLFVQPDIVEAGLREEDRLVLCSDGVWSAIEDDELARLVTAGATARQASEDLVGRALDRGSDDNCSAIVVHIRRLAPATAAGSPRAQGWFASLRDRLRSSDASQL